MINSFTPRFLKRLSAVCGLLLAPLACAAEPSLLFYVSAQDSLSATIAGGDPQPNFVEHIQRSQTGVADASGNPGWAIEWADDGVLSWNAPGNIYAQRGTLSFFWRPGYPVGEAPFVIFRVGYADHSSWDMAWLRIDWNGSGFDAFVTDANLARTRVSFALPQAPAPERWLHLAFAWDEHQGVSLYVDGKAVASKKIQGHLATGDFATGLDQFGLAGRVLSPHQVQSRYNFLRGSHIAELRIYDRMLTPAAITALRHNQTPPAAKAIGFNRNAWYARYGWEQQAPPLLQAGHNSFRKIELTDTYDLKQWMWKATDGIAETTWPGVYNRSRLPGRNDYFQLPDWNTYVEGGKNFDVFLPDETINRIELRGAAFGQLQHRPQPEAPFTTLAKKAQGAVRSVFELAPIQGGQLRFSNTEQETPIQEFWAYQVGSAPEPEGSVKLRYHIRADAVPDYENLSELRHFIAGRYLPAERDTVMAIPRGASIRTRKTLPGESASPLAHILIPSSVSHAPPGKSLTRSWAYGWENMHDGLDGIAIDLPPLNIKATHKGGVVPLNIRVKDPLWPMRDLIDISLSVKPNQAYSLWLDTRDRILSSDSFYITIAAAAPEFNSHLLDGAEIRLVFKAREQALAEHTTDRFNQVRDNWGFLVEEHTTSQRQQLYRRAHADISDLLRADPNHELGRRYWAYMSYGSQGLPSFTQPQPPVALPVTTPLWAFRQSEALKLIRQHINWWIDHRQVAYGDFGGGISDDSDLVQQWPGLALMGVDPDKINASITALADAAYRNDMFTEGLPSIETDELHVYEEGINTNSALFLLNWGQPWAAERLMETVDALHRIVKPNPQGHWLFSSNWFSGKKIYREENWQWQKPYSFPITHPALMLGEFNADPRSRQLITNLADGYLAHSYTAADGQWALPNEIHWRTGKTRGGEMHNGAGAGDLPTLFWSAWHWSGDAKYLQVLDYRVARAGEGSLARLNDNFLDLLNKRDTWGKTLADAAGPGRDFENFIAWENSGNKEYLEQLYADQIRMASLSMYFNTEGHWWSDRVEARHDLLQRARLGGVALSRNRTYPGHTLSWRFDDPEGAVQVAILMPRARADKFKVIAYNLSDKPQRAQMTGWNISAGQWQLTTGIDSQGDDRIDQPLTRQVVHFEKTQSLPVEFPPGQTLVLEMQLLEAGAPVETRPDLAIGRGDVVLTAPGAAQKQQLRVRVHSLGHSAAPAGEVRVENAKGEPLAVAAIAPLAAPTTLQPQTTEINLSLPQGVVLEGARVCVALANNAAEITQLNNCVGYGDWTKNRPITNKRKQ